MSTHWTYDATKFSDATAGYYGTVTIGQRYQVRLWLQDTITTRQLFQDEEIDFQISVSANQAMAAAFLCDVLVARAGMVKSKQISEFRIQYDPEFYRQLSATLKAQGMNYEIPYCGGISISDKEAQKADTDAVVPAFSKGLMDNPAAPQPQNPPSNPLTSL